jgi:hypothetical protein
MERAERSKASPMLRRALKARTQRWRRRQVVGFYLMMLICSLLVLGDDHHGFHAMGRVLCPLVIACCLALGRWPRDQQRVVASLDDRALIEHGVGFDRLSEMEQQEVLREYRVGIYVMDRSLDERQEASRLRAFEAAFQFLRVGLPVLAGVYWMVYQWAPDGAWRDSMMDSPVVISWLAVFVISLPQVIVMWTEPDEVGEPKVVEREA